MNLIKTVSTKLLCITGAVISLFGGCKDNGSKSPAKTNLFITTNAGSVYAFDIVHDQLLWEKEVRDSNIDELTYFSFYKDEVIKSYLNARIVGMDRTTGKEKWTYEDKVSPDQQYYDYNFSDVRFVHFYQEPTVYQNAMLFANSHGEIKSVDIPTLKENWIYQSEVPLLSAPQILGSSVYMNIGYRLLKLSGTNGKLLQSYNFDEGSSFPVRINENKIFLLTEKGTVICWNDNLEAVWTFSPQDENLHISTNLLIHDDQILVGNNKLLSIDKGSGKLKWELDLKDPGIFSDGKHAEEVSNSGTEIRSLVPTDDGFVLNTSTHIVTVSKKGKVLQKYAWPESDTLMGLSYQNGYYYVVTKSGKLFKTDQDFKERKLLKENINFNFERGLEDVFFKFD
ncbi:PQQ-binding-like beta-propeller repeat protein [Sphingobacterium spiritivorum]|uniref:outer membrane protein assembly factor BamB family protein n=1 Tax=Sphingobacterium spiritivorum TaxID=258 RepID=UPI003DA6CB95